MEKRGKVLIVLLAILVVGAAIVIALDTHARNETKTSEIKIFQKAVGGLGLGAIAAPMWQFMNYDFRIQSVDDSVTWPVPGGYSYGPDRTGNITYFEETAASQWIAR